MSTGTEFAGRVDEIDGQTEFRVGDEVFGIEVQARMRNTSP